MSINIYIRIVFGSLMLLPLTMLIYFLISYSKNPDCITSYLKNKKNKSVLMSNDIGWPENGLLTLWFDNGFLVGNKKEILDLMNQYQFKGVISLTKGKSCYSQSISINELNQLQDNGWEITGTNLRFDNNKINEMPAFDAKNLATYDMSSEKNVAALNNYLKKTQMRNGWIILYFHEKAATSTERPMSIVKFRDILEMVKLSGIPIVLPAQVVKVSQ